MLLYESRTDREFLEAGFVKETKAPSDRRSSFTYRFLWMLGLGIGLPFIWLAGCTIVDMISPGGHESYASGIAELSMAFLLSIFGGLVGLCLPRKPKDRNKNRADRFHRDG